MIYRIYNGIIEDKKEAEIELYSGHSSDFNTYYPYLWELLSDQERERASKFYFDADRLTYVTSHGITRLLIGSELKVEPQTIVFCKNQYEKPFLPDNSLYFNMSHTRTVFAIAISKQNPVGVDVEGLDRKLDLTLMSKYFSEAERSMLDNEPLTNFYAVWTRKEAILKAIGCGIINELALINTSMDIFPPIPVLNDHYDPTIGAVNYYLDTLLFDSFIVSLACPSEFNLRYMQLSNERFEDLRMEEFED